MVARGHFTAHVGLLVQIGINSELFTFTLLENVLKFTVLVIRAVTCINLHMNYKFTNL
jgi:hypothetical protein